MEIQENIIIITLLPSSGGKGREEKIIIINNNKKIFSRLWIALSFHPSQLDLSPALHFCILWTKGRENFPKSFPRRELFFFSSQKKKKKKPNNNKNSSGKLRGENWQNWRVPSLSDAFTNSRKAVQNCPPAPICVLPGLLYLWACINLVPNKLNSGIHSEAC